MDSFADSFTGSKIASLVSGFDGGYINRFARNVAGRFVSGFSWSLQTVSHWFCG
jgi:hypothetical protein